MQVVGNQAASCIQDLTKKEIEFLIAYRAADDQAREYALDLLSWHPRETAKQSNGEKKVIPFPDRNGSGN